MRKFNVYRFITRGGFETVDKVVRIEMRLMNHSDLLISTNPLICKFYKKSCFFPIEIRGPLIELMCNMLRYSKDSIGER